LIQIRDWERKALQLQSRLFGGATSYPAKGSYRRRKSGRVLIEQTKLITSFIREVEFTDKALKEATDFIKEFGAETDQETVAFVLDGEMYWIEI
jgi:DNA relaxase NicK